MARTRNLKPGFFTNDQLAEIEPLGRLLFQGLWCHADREGRLLDRGKKLKAEILPYDDCDVEYLLEELRSREFIQRYDVGGVKYIQINTFSKHQNPHMKESASTIPAPGKNGAGTIPAGPHPLTLNPSSLTLNPHPSTLEPDAETRLTNPYFLDIEEHFGKRRGSLWMMTPKDFALVEIWKDAGIPLEAVLRGIDATFDNHDRRNTLQRINSIKYCEQEVLKACEQMKAAQTGRP